MYTYVYLYMLLQGHWMDLKCGVNAFCVFKIVSVYIY